MLLYHCICLGIFIIDAGRGNGAAADAFIRHGVYLKCLHMLSDYALSWRVVAATNLIRFFFVIMSNQFDHHDKHFSLNLL